MAKPVEISHLTKDYGANRAVNDVSFTIEPGEIFGLLGPNGAGKTTIISTMVTLERPTSGRVQVFGYDVTRNPREAKLRLGLVPQELIHHGFFSVIEILRFHSGFYGRFQNEERIEFLLKKCHLWEDRHKKVKQLSGGMKRRLLIAKSLVHDPALVLLDEPTAGVDIELRNSLWEFVRELKAQGKSILLTTHYLQEAEMLCDRVGILQKGTLRRIDQTGKLIRELTQREISIRFREVQTELASHPRLAKQNDSTYTFRVPSSMAVGDLLSESAIDVSSVLDIQIREGNLEEAFQSVLGARP